MSKIGDILSELGVSKVRLAKYLGVSRQMLYNYLSCDNLEDWPSEKATRLMQLLEVKSAKEIDDIIEKEYGDTKQEIIEVPQEDGSILRKSTLSQETLQTKILNRIEDELLKKVVLFPKNLSIDNMSTAVRTELLKCLSEEKVEAEEPELL